MGRGTAKSSVLRQVSQQRSPLLAGCCIPRRDWVEADLEGALHQGGAGKRAVGLGQALCANSHPRDTACLAQRLQGQCSQGGGHMGWARG